MPRKTKTIAPIPKKWLDTVVSLLEVGGSDKIEWPLRTQNEMAALGFIFNFEAEEYCKKNLLTPGILGEQIFGMIDERDGVECETWAFLCPHPMGNEKPVYVKIGLHSGKLIIHFFSLHIDTKGTLLKAIRAYRSI